MNQNVNGDHANQNNHEPDFMQNRQNDQLI